VCFEIQEEYLKKTGVIIHLNHNTRCAMAKGGQTKAQSDATKGWFTVVEEDVLMKFAIEMANWGWPLSHGHLKEHANAILKAKLGNCFPDGGVGK
ncbi:hypothetical protein BDQ17DRAFT_1233319, partial [Cyathus striatus]